MQQTGLSSIELSDNSYTVKQKLFRNAYKVYNSDDEEVLNSTQKMFKMQEEFPFKDAEDNEVFTVKADQIMDISGDYVITDPAIGEKVAVLKKRFHLVNAVISYKGR